MKLDVFFKIIFIVTIFIFNRASLCNADNYHGWDNSFVSPGSDFDLSVEDSNIIILENEYKNNIFLLLQKNKIIETELKIIRIKLSGLETPIYSYDSMGGVSTLGLRIANTAAILSGKQYWPNACAYAVNEVLKALGIDIAEKVNNNPNWVPNYANLGLKIPSLSLLHPGDLIIYDNAVGEGGYDHIGIYSGNGMAYNVSTSNNYKFVLTSIGSTFMEGRRLEFYEGSFIPSPIIIENKENYHKIIAIQLEEYLLKAEESINKEKAHMDYIKKSNIFYRLKIHNITKKTYKASKDYFKKQKLFREGCISKNVLKEGKEKFTGYFVNRYKLYKERILFKLVNVPCSLNIITSENKSAKNNLNKVRFSPVELKKEVRLKLTALEKINETIKLYLCIKREQYIKSSCETVSEFPPLKLGSKESELSLLENYLKEAEQSLDEAKKAYEKAQDLYSLGYIAKKDLETIGNSYQKALTNYQKKYEELINYRP